MNDIGFVEYSKNMDDNYIEAKWFYYDKGVKRSGTGLVQGKFNKTFDGDFHVTYYDNDGSETSSFQLKINFDAGHYHLKWIKNGKIEYFGIGIEYDNKLFASWRKFIE